MAKPSFYGDSGIASLGDFFLEGIIGLADWIGLGGWIRRAVEDDPKIKSNKQVLKLLQEQIDKKLAQGQLDLDRLYEATQKYPSVNISVSGRAADALGKDYTNKEKQRKEAVDKYNKANANHMIRVAKGEALKNEIATLPETMGQTAFSDTDLQKHYKQQIEEI